MVNTDDFIKRLETILDYYSLSASVFADKLGVQRSGLSHLLSGRNKPSLDFIMKIVEHFSEVDIYWLINGSGSFPKKEDGFVAQIQAAPAPVPSPPQDKKEPAAADLFSQTDETAPIPTAMKVENKTGKKIEKVVIFYSDGTFRDYSPEN